MTVAQFKTKAEKFEEEVVKTVMKAKASVIVYLEVTPDGEGLEMGYILGHCDPAQASAILNEASANLRLQVLQDILISEDSDGEKEHG